MFSTIFFIALLVLLVLASVVLWALFLRLGLQWARVTDVTSRQIIVATVVVILLQMAMELAVWLASAITGSQSVLLDLAVIAATVVIPCCVIMRVFKTRFLRAFQSWLPTLLTPVVMIAVALLLLRPFLYETYVVPTNAMAPTLLGDHWQGVCPECSADNYCSPLGERSGSRTPVWMICDNFHAAQVSHPDERVGPRDHLLVAKFLAPRRWDVVVFDYPDDPSQVFVKRLVGLPGEKIYIQDGSVWVDGEKLAPPESIRGIEYLAQLPFPTGVKSWGSPDRPAQLGEDEYFVLGDFSAWSHDSRYWEHGAPGHNPFAVPESYLKGVVTHIYWPVERWRRLR
jgi:signal peptidase I